MNHELTGPIVWKNDAKRIAYGAVLVPNEPDTDGDILTAEKIADVAHDWLAKYGNIDLQHSLNNVAEPVESYILPADMRVSIKGVDSVLPAGTWILATVIKDNDLWERVLKGELSGYSVMGVRSAVATKSADGAPDDAAYKRTMLADLGADWVAPFVSLVDEPAVPKAKFFAIKACDKSRDNFFSRLTRGAINANKEAKKMDEKQMQERIDEAIKSVRDEMAEAIQSLKAKDEAQVDEATKAAEAEAAAKAAEELAAKDAEIAALKAKVEEMTEGQSKAIEALKERVEKLSEKLSPARSRAIKSADVDGQQTTEQKPDRDAFGRKIR